MLAEGGQAPKPPRPRNWPGVDRGLEEAAAWLHEGRLEEAERALEAVMEFSPDEPRAWALLAQLAERKGDEALAARAKEKAERLASRALSGMPVGVRLAKLYWRRGEKQTARAMLALLLIQRPDDPNVRKLLGEWGSACASG